MAENIKHEASSLPDDVVTIRQYGSWTVYFSQSSNSLFLATTDYHAGPLRLTKQDLLEFLTGLEKWSEEREKAVVSELKNNPELLAQMELLIARNKIVRPPR